ncbi:MAG: hypothetical protein DSO00_01665 [Archaeoglobi archaeon]|nr:MAG: hypothetical protein DSO00_01665 [Archaeoglobi archaeon]
MGYIHIAYLGFPLQGNVPKTFPKQNYLNLDHSSPELELWAFWAPIFIKKCQANTSTKKAFIKGRIPFFNEPDRGS